MPIYWDPERVSASLATVLSLPGFANFRPDSAPLWVNLLGGAAGTIGVLTQWPQVWRLWYSGKYAGLSTLSCALGVIGGLSWLTYGIGRGSSVQIFCNVLGTLGAAAVLAGVIVRAKPEARRWVPPLVVGVLVIIGIRTLGGVHAIGTFAAVVTMSVVGPQVFVLAKGRLAGDLDATGVSKARWLLAVICNCGWVSYAYLTGDPNIGTASGSMVVLATAVLVLCSSASPPALAAPSPQLEGGTPRVVRAYHHVGVDQWRRLRGVPRVGRQRPAAVRRRPPRQRPFTQVNVDAKIERQRLSEE